MAGTKARSVKKTLMHKIGFGRFTAPLWALLVGGLAIAGAAGQAVGPILSGNVTGQAGVTASQTLLLSPQGSGGHEVTVPSTGVTYPGNWVITVNDEQTEFSAAVETVVGRALTIGLSIENESTLTGTPANGHVKLHVPAGVRVQVDGDNALSGNLAQMNANTWLFTATGSSGAYNPNNSDLKITFKTYDDAAPGFYTIRGSIVQVTN